ncbi:MAG: hypothetical protein A3I77_06090 [Gammaproteobacteria bacterium RIFCSPLOWO2_02_FULL_42_14]|nr:MAG: hypothetical protein A3B71_06680 [Gammaproteobacteria bacterium RIFCSPHIGHO2_02_FULL_42_43]OGT52566.1 MAG: hypothetical protein A3E54_06285 [Gammaproteobacteria bacterium RIFCSPHIGHO2_12_FULL_41_25]OGT63164.1 MAG: hypothetical protein A3I77_06090 [Gammaproteobacteria bacterium RIFCSPLOWO2_02_FULL_42_14]OGT86664.1 MAG: hypothetical protein A3G86_04910 [Gammaproteobacteria bacterium RIFCSPLOWO2_12_FULL_42_18]
MLKKILTITILSAAATFSAFADDQTTENAQQQYTPPPAAPPEAHAGYFLGTNYATYGGNDFAAMLGYVDHSFLIDAGMGYERISPYGSSSISLYELRGDVGLRCPLVSQLYFTYGMLGSYGFRDPSSTATRVSPYAIGGFTGLDYQPMRNLLLSFRLAPIAYQRDYTKGTHTNFFSDGSIGVAYLFE